MTEEKVSPLIGQLALSHKALMAQMYSRSFHRPKEATPIEARPSAPAIGEPRVHISIGGEALGISLSPDQALNLAADIHAVLDKMRGVPVDEESAEGQRIPVEVGG